MSEIQFKTISPYKNIRGLKKFKGNWHSHMASEFPSPSRAREICGKGAFDFLGITDHDNRYTILKWSEEDWHKAYGKNFLIIRGFEATHPIGHITCLGFTPEQTGIDAETARKNRDEQAGMDAGYGDFLIRASSMGAFLALNHPTGWRNRAKELVGTKDFKLIDALEIYNGSQMKKSCEKGYTADVFDECLSLGAEIWCASNPDCHSWKFNELDSPLNGFSVVYAEALTRHAILEALKEGRFYASNGPELEEIKVTNESIEISSSVPGRISFSGPGGKVFKQTECKKANYNFTGSEGYVRPEFEAANASVPGSGGFPLKAWLQPVKLKSQTQT